MRILLVLLGSSVGFAAVQLLHLGGTYGLPWLMVAVATLASLYGLGWGLLAAAGAFALQSFLGATVHPGWSVLMLLVTVGIADLIGKDLRRAYRRQQEAAAQLSLLVAVLEELSELGSQAAILRALPGLLGRYGEGHVSVWQPQPGGMGLVSAVGLDQGVPTLLESGVVARCAREGQPLHLPDVHQDPGYIAVPHSDILSELALPLLERGQVVAVLNLERGRRFSPRELEGFIHFARAVSAQLTQLSERSEIQFLNQLSASLDSATTPQGVAERALALLVEALGMEQGWLWMQQGTRMVALASYGGETEMSEITYGQGLVWEVYRTGRPVYTENYGESPQAIPEFRQTFGGVVAHPVPLPNQERPRVVLSLQQKSPRLWREAEQDLLAAACRTLGLALDGVLAAQQRDTLIALSREAAEAPVEAVYSQILGAAVRLVPGAEAGSLLVREGAEFRFKALLGFDPSLKDLTFSEAEQFHWYAGSAQNWHRGEPRILSSAGTDLKQFSSENILEPGRVDEIAANLALPVVYRGEVLAILYLDNLCDPAAFGEDSLVVARFFAAPIAALLHEVRYRGLLERAAATDALTGLLNRRAFDAQLEEELGRAQRYGHPLSLLVMDLRGFKGINDRLGHAKGDEALVRVAEALGRSKRDGDLLFRWGGDEFAALLSHTDLAGATAAAQRYAAAIENICIEGLALGVNIGAAAYPTDAEDHDALLRRADQRMYQAKSCGIPVIDP
jgi:diguanylate cyclase (GGDEF)-like protein